MDTYYTAWLSIGLWLGPLAGAGLMAWSWNTNGFPLAVAFFAFMVLRRLFGRAGALSDAGDGQLRFVGEGEDFLVKLRDIAFVFPSGLSRGRLSLTILLRPVGRRLIIRTATRHELYWGVWVKSGVPAYGRRNSKLERRADEFMKR